jgi:hypothetical protein
MYIDPKELGRLLKQKISPKHDKITKQVLLEKVPVFDTEEHFVQIFDWIRNNIFLTNLEDNKHALETNGSYVLRYYEDEDDDENMMDCETNCEDEFIRLIPEELNLKTMIYLHFSICLINELGINWDSRGTENIDLEFDDFHSDWIIPKGVTTISNLANGFFKIKSHKFDNWYEGVWGIINFELKKSPDYENYNYSRAEITFDVNHGS